jgi:hypothetical protein
MGFMISGGKLRGRYLARLEFEQAGPFHQQGLERQTRQNNIDRNAIGRIHQQYAVPPMMQNCHSLSRKNC